MATRRVAGLVLAALGLAALQTGAQAETKLVLGSAGVPGSLIYVTEEQFAKWVDERSGGEIKVDYFHSSQIGNHKEMLQKVKLGTQEMVTVSTVMSTVQPEFGLYDMPYLVKDRVHAGCISSEIVFPELAPKIESQGYKLLGVWENGFRQITNNVRPINRPDDLKGIKLRTPRGIWRIKMFETYGANPTPMAFSEVFVALQTGVMDGQENPYTNIWAAKFQEVQKYLSVTNHVYAPFVLLINKRKWDGLDDKAQKVLWDTAQDIQAWTYEKAAELDEKNLKQLRDAGMQYNLADRESFVEASKPVYAEFAKEVKGGQALIDKALSLANGC